MFLRPHWDVSLHRPDQKGHLEMNEADGWGRVRLGADPGLGPSCLLTKTANYGTLFILNFIK